MTEATRRLVRQRAETRCEYCRLAEEDDIYTFHVEHVIPQKHGGDDVLANLALACQQCNLHKGSNLSGFDPQTSQLTRLFNPRVDVWDQHFQLVDSHVVGLSEVGRTTVAVLSMNDQDRVLTRRLLRM